ncbi:E3 ubiquitin-protein ligase RFI2-like [Andrographis paniculata]|uniref:E3 ubiquitin-protein ligase RFI2-like n=1 Tax=Andrographis paniculata TaxID=175694 RepID=UPI0021E82A9F|nr:E3 ubiquitin-protein ligase RFI2-like [Andrographis paniculata]
MGLGEIDLFDDAGGKAAAPMSVSCSICLEAVVDNGDRSWAKLQCGHQFHLDCIGSAFNVKGSMQCPNCRKIEKGQWLYSNGSRSLADFSMDDWAHDEDLYELSYSEMSFGVHWCPFSTVTRLPSSFEEGEFQSRSYHNLLGHHAAVFAEHNPASSTTHPCPYIAYLGPVEPSSSTSSGSIPDGPSFNGHWSGPSLPSEVPFPTLNFSYHDWDHLPPFSASNRTSNPDQLPAPSMTHRAARNGSDVPRQGMHPFIISHSSGGRAPGSLTSSILPTYPNAVAPSRDRPPSIQPYVQQPPGPPTARSSHTPSGRRSSSHMGLAQVPSMASSSDQSSGFFFFSPSSSSRTYQEGENLPVHDRFHGWEREQRQQTGFLQSQSQSQADRDSIWGPFHPPTSGFRMRHGSERMPSQNR